MTDRLFRGKAGTEAEPASWQHQEQLSLGDGYAEAYAAIIAYGTSAAGYWRKSRIR
jgi:hypothetical protein